MILLNNHSISRRRNALQLCGTYSILWVASAGILAAQAPAAPQPGPPPYARSFTNRQRWTSTITPVTRRSSTAKSFRLGGGSHSMACGEWRHRWRIQQGHPVANTYIWRRNLIAKDFDLRLEIKCEIAGGSGIQYRSQTGLPWNKPPRPGGKPLNLDWMMTGPQADFWYPVNPLHASYSGQFYSENTPLASSPGAVRSSPPPRAPLPASSELLATALRLAAM